MIFVTNNDRMGKNIRYLRRKENLTLEALARFAGMDPADLDAIERGVQPEIDGHALSRICRRLRVDGQALVEENLE